MEQLLNNAFFWQKLDTLIFSLEYKKVRSVGDVHPQYSNLVYPIEYGYLVDTDQEGAVVSKVFKGSLSSRKIESIIVGVDILQKGMDIKLMVGCTQEEEMTCLEFLNQTAFQKTILIRRSDVMPQWAFDD